MKRALLILCTIIAMTAVVAISEVTMETSPATPINNIMQLWSADDVDNTTFTLTGASDSDSTCLYFHEPFSALLVVVTCDSSNVIVSTRNGYAAEGADKSHASTSEFYFKAATVQDTITAAGTYIYPVSVEESMHLFHTFESLTGNGISVVKAFAIRRKYE